MKKIQGVRTSIPLSNRAEIPGMRQETKDSVLEKIGSILGPTTTVRRRRDKSGITWPPVPSHPGTDYLVRDPLT